MSLNLAVVHEAVAEVVPDRDCIVWRDRRLSYAQVTDRTRRLAAYLRGRGVGMHTPREQLEGWESGQDHVALYMHNCNEYLEGMLGAFKARAVPCNVNYRYVEEELRYLLRDAGARVVIYQGRFAPALARVMDQATPDMVLIQVEDGSGETLLPGAIEYETALASCDPSPPQDLSPDDLYMLYTGGTTGMPKGVLWRQADVYVAALGGRQRDGSQIESAQQVQDRVRRGKATRVVTAPPMMHGAAHWVAFQAFGLGHTVVMQANSERFDAHDVLSTIERERATQLLIVGDAFARPLVDQLERASYDLTTLKHVVSSGAALHPNLKDALIQQVEGLTIVDALGSSETGPQGQHKSDASGKASSGRFTPSQGSCVLDEAMEGVLPPGHDGIGWFAQTGQVPLGYLGDEDKTRRTFPVINSVRYAAPGDRARHLADGEIELHGRDSVTINSGGEKIFAEEVEEALKQHPDVYDAVVCGRASERWGQEVCAIVRPRPGAELTREALLDECGRHVARYKLPKLIVFLEEIQRSPSGKADYRWAKQQVSQVSP